MLVMTLFFSATTHIQDRLGLLLGSCTSPTLFGILDDHCNPARWVGDAVLATCPRAQWIKILSRAQRLGRDNTSMNVRIQSKIDGGRVTVSYSHDSCSLGIRYYSRRSGYGIRDSAAILRGSEPIPQHSLVFENMWDLLVLCGVF